MPTPDRPNVLIRRLEIAVQALLGAFVLLAVADKWREGADLAAALAAAGALALARLKPFPAAAARQAGLAAAALGTFLAANLVAALAAPRLESAGSFRYEHLHVTGVLVALAAGLGLREAAAVRRMLGLLLAAAGFWYAADLASAWWPSRAAFDPAGRFLGFRGYPNELANELAIVLTLALGWALADRRRRETLAAGGAAALAGALLLATQVRSALLAAALAGTPAALSCARRLGGTGRRALLVGLWAAVLVPAAGLAWYHLAGAERRTPRTAQARLEIYGAALRVAAREPWWRLAVGNGPSSRVFRGAALRYGAGPTVVLDQQVKHAHNVELQVLLESGLLGLLALAGAWLAAFRSAWRAWRAPDAEAAWPAGALLAGLLVVAAAGQFDYTLLKVAGRLSWLVTGLALASGSLTAAAEGNSRP